MLLRHTANYGLLACLMALLALGLQPVRASKLVSEQSGNTEQAPVEEPGDEEEEADEDSEEVIPIRRHAPDCRHNRGEALYIASISSQARPPSAIFSVPRISPEHAARNGIGGPLRL